VVLVLLLSEALQAAEWGLSALLEAAGQLWGLLLMEVGAALVVVNIPVSVQQPIQAAVEVVWPHLPMAQLTAAQAAQASPASGGLNKEQTWPKLNNPIRTPP
jgi:hypothetical protein